VDVGSSAPLLLGGAPSVGPQQEEQMRPKTSVRPPVIAGVRGRKLSDLLRAWRGQPRQRSPKLFWGLVALAFLFDSALVLLGVHLLGAAEPSSEGRRMHVPYADNAALWEPLRRWVIRIDGRPRLFESFCREAVRSITGMERFEDNDPLAIVFSWMLCDPSDRPQAAGGEAEQDFDWDKHPFLRVDNPALSGFLRGAEEQSNGLYIEPDRLRYSESFQKLLRAAAAKSASPESVRLSPLEKQALRLGDCLELFERIRAGKVDGGGGAEMEAARAALREAYQSGADDLFAAAVADFLDASHRALQGEDEAASRCRLACEGWFNDQAPFQKALYFSMAAVGLLAAASMAGARRPLGQRVFLVSGLVACAGCLGWSAAGFFCRAILHGGAPVSDGQEVLLWAASLTVCLGLALALLCRDSIIALAGSLASIPEFALANRWPLAFSADWPELPDLLSGDFWLNLHVLTLVSAHAALILAWGVAVLTLGLLVLAPPGRERLLQLGALCARSIGIGVVLLAAGVVFGRFCATEPGASWRGWDAQAVCALLTLPACGALLYARRMGWLQPFGLVTCSTICFTLIVLVWHGTLFLGAWNQDVAPTLSGWVYWGGILNMSLAVHAALRYYFGRQLDLVEREPRPV
jgi:hypothetical protein